MGPAAAVVAVATAFSDLFKFLATPEGQLFLKMSREQQEAFWKRVGQAGDWVEGNVKLLANVKIDLT